MAPKLAQRAFFDFMVPVGPRPKTLRIDGSLREWDDKTLLPDFSLLEGKKGNANVHLAWDDAGLYLGLNVLGKKEIVSDPKHPGNTDAFFVWVDTRNVKGVHRASAFCHMFVALPTGGGKKRDKPFAAQRQINRARENSPQCDPKVLRVASRIRKDGYSLELAIPAKALHGFDPEDSPQLGFAYIVRDHELGPQTWTSPSGFPIWHDPSTWGTVELTGG